MERLCSPFSACDTPGSQVNHIPKGNLVPGIRYESTTKIRMRIILQYLVHDMFLYMPCIGGSVRARRSKTKEQSARYIQDQGAV